MPSSQKVHIFIAAVIFVLTVISDQLLKIAIRQAMIIGEHVSFAGGFLHLIHIENTGGFLGIVNRFDERTRFLLLTVGVAFFLLWGLWYMLSSSRPMAVIAALSAVLGGGAGNLLDRLLHDGKVTDYLLININGLQTGIFNLADVYILSGSAFLGYYFFSRDHH